MKLKDVIIFASGGAIGSVVTRYFVRKKAMAMLDEEIEKTREYFLNAQKEGKIIEKEYRKPTDSIERYSGPTEEAEVVDYTSYYIHKEDPAESEHPEEDSEDLVRSEMMEKEADDDGIEIIDQESYDIDYPQFEKEELTYWSMDEVLSDSMEKIVDNVSDVVGSTIYSSGLVEKPDVRTIYIRNFNLGCDYCIHKLIASYKENVIS